MEELECSQLLLQKRKKCTVYNIDINPDAAKFCQKNIAINKLAGNIISIHGDAFDVIRNQLENKSDRTLMLLPEKSDEFLNLAILAAQKIMVPFTTIHIFMQTKNQMQ